jgi:mannose-6-phosphate isomerase-like protein (cupin superfamily)
MRKISLRDLPDKKTSHKGVGLKKVIIASGYIPNLMQFAKVIFQPGEVAPLHEHSDLYETFYVTSGNGVMNINNKDISLTVGDCITVEPGEKHILLNNGFEPLELIYFMIQKNDL